LGTNASQLRRARADLGSKRRHGIINTLILRAYFRLLPARVETFMASAYSFSWGSGSVSAARPGL
jgi:hypothetical protein